MQVKIDVIFIKLINIELNKWRLGSESNRRLRICNPLHNHCATQPIKVAYISKNNLNYKLFFSEIKINYDYSDKNSRVSVFIYP